MAQSQTMTTTTRTERAPTRGEQAAGTGLHGHSFAADMASLAAAEAIGTFVLVLSIISTVIGATLARPVAGFPYDSLAVPLAGGVGLAIGVASLGHISGAHFNPAVTVGLALNRRFPLSYVPTYLLAQFAGAIGAALVAWTIFGDRARTVANLGATSPASGVTSWRAFVAEVVVTFLLVLVIVSVATDNRVPSGVAAVAIGWALSAAIFISGPVSGAGVNPARAIGPMIPDGKFTDWWLYLVGPLVGGALAATVYDRFLRRVSAPDPG
jgi:MIP family channel proteins